MTVRAPYFVSAFAAAAVLGLGSHHGGSETLNGAGAARADISSGKTSAPPRALSRARPSTRATGTVAVATRQFDLKKLTMADFGDVEPSR